MSVTKKWRCTVCGQVFEGDQPPVPCPVCGAGASAFVLEQQDGLPKWRCTVCNQVFDGENPPVPCPICGAGASAFELIYEATQAYQKDTQENFVIVGGGIAALETAKAIRKRNNTATITMICKEGVLPYNRPALSDVLADSLSFDSIVLEPGDWYRQNRVTLVTDANAAKIDRDNKTVTLSNGKVLPYDKLMLATGANAFAPILPQPGSVPVYTLRNYSDAVDIMKQAKSGTSCVLVGGGILGIEGALALRDRGVKVTVVEMGGRILNVQADPFGSEVLTKAMTEAGVTIITNSGVDGVLPDGAKLKDGTVIQADFVLVSAGIRSEMTLAQDCGLETGRGILVNTSMRTGDSSIFAAGDCAEVLGRVAGLYSAASAGGQVAGAVMAGEELIYTPIIPATAFEQLGISLFVVGTVNGEKLKFATYHDQFKGIYKKLAFDEHGLCGVVLLGDTEQSVKAMKSVGSAVGMKEALEILA